MLKWTSRNNYSYNKKGTKPNVETFTACQYRQNRGGGGYFNALTSLALAALLLFTANDALADIILDKESYGQFYENYGKVETAVVTDTSGLGEGLFNLGEKAHIRSAEVIRRGLIVNGDGAFIETAEIGRQGVLVNRVGALIDTATLNDGAVVNVGRIDNLTYTSGIYEGIDGRDRGAIGTLTVAGDSSRVDWGNVTNLNNLSTGIVGTFTMNNTGSAVNNGGYIDDLTYNAGAYNRTYLGSTGTIGTLNVAGNSYGINWGNLDIVNILNSGVLYTRSGDTIGTANVNGGLLSNYYNAIIEQATVNSGNLYNFNTAHIESATVSGGTLHNTQTATIGSATVNSGTLSNSSDASIGIGTATVNGGTLNNSNTATIDSLSQTGGTVNNGGRINEMTYTGGNYVGTYNSNAGTIGTINVAGNASGINWGNLDIVNILSGGTLYTRSDDTIGTANVNGGLLYNFGTATIVIGTATVNGGTLHNSTTATIDSLSQNSGTVENVGRINEMTYTGGNYVGSYLGSTGSIGTLNVAGNSRSINWGSVTNLNNLSTGIVGAFTMSSGMTVNNGGTIDNLTYNAGAYNRTYLGSTGTISTLNVAGNASGIIDWGDLDTANVYGNYAVYGIMINTNTIGTATVSGSGVLHNESTATIESATVSGSGILNNFSTARIESATVSGSGALGNTDTARIESATVSGGILSNFRSARIESATVSGGTLNNYGNARIVSATVSGGTLNNYGTAIIDSMNLLGGTVNNGSRIGNLFYTGGLYNGTYDSQTGTIDRLIIAGNLISSNDWGQVGTLALNTSGSTINSLTVSGTDTSTTAVFGGQSISVDARFENYGGRIINATVDGGRFSNSDNGTINDATLNGGKFDNDGRVFSATVNGGALANGGTINDALVNSGFVDNSGGRITGAIVNGGWVDNTSGGVITDATINGGGLLNDKTGVITNASVADAGRLYNETDGRVYNATVNKGGAIHNDGGEINRVTVNDGRLYNYVDSTVDIAVQKGGTVTNKGRIENMTYANGTYVGREVDWQGNNVALGSIGTLNIAGNLYASNDWGTVENLQFDSSGSGVLSIAGFADGGDFGLMGVKAANANFANGNVSLDLSGVAGIGNDYWATAFFDAFGYENGFYLSDLVGASSFSGVSGLSSLGVAWDDESYWILQNGELGSGWGINAATGFVSYDTGGAPVPEPATLAILGLGLVGLGWARRRRK